jgi:hypothetical protein
LAAVTRISFGPVHSTSADIPHQGDHRFDVADARDVRQANRLAGEQACGSCGAPFLFPAARTVPDSAPPSMTGIP